MDFPLPIPAPLRAAVPRGARAIVAASGGVDSSVSMALLRHLGCEVEAVTFLMGEEPGGTARDPRAVADAARVCGELGVRHHVLALGEPFARLVTGPYLRDHEAGLTPNPCVVCNASLRFPELRRLREAYGATLAATGHHARLQEVDGSVRLLRSLDPEKDQSYFLHAVERKLLEDFIFPIGWYGKAAIREAARRLGLAVAERPESQEACFLPPGRRATLFRGGPGDRPGPIVDRRGDRLGTHRGLAHYTVGQRRGLGVCRPAPLYVLALDAAGNRLVAGPRAELAVGRVLCDRVVLHERLPAASSEGRGLLARVRHRHPGVGVAGWRLGVGTLEVDLAGAAEGVAPGQFLVLYRAEVVVGGGRIVAAGASGGGSGTGG